MKTTSNTSCETSESLILGWNAMPEFTLEAAPAAEKAPSLLATLWAKFLA